MHLTYRAKDLQCIGTSGIQEVGNRETLVLNCERFAVVSFSTTHFAIDINVRQKTHLDLTNSIALACFASAAFYIEAESAGLVATRARLRQHGVQFADRREHTSVCCWIRARRPADRRLVNFDDLVDQLETLN